MEDNSEMNKSSNDTPINLCEKISLLSNNLLLIGCHNSTDEIFGDLYRLL
jgi:hypothetical protein